MELGDLYQVLIKKATLCGLRTSIHIISRGSGTRSFLSENDVYIVSLIYRTTPCTPRSISIIADNNISNYIYFVIDISFQLYLFHYDESSIFYSFIARIYMEKLARSTRSSCMCFSRLFIFKLAILKPFNLVIACSGRS